MRWRGASLADMAAPPPADPIESHRLAPLFGFIFAVLVLAGIGGAIVASVDEPVSADKDKAAEHSDDEDHSEDE